MERGATSAHSSDRNRASARATDRHSSGRLPCERTTCGLPLKRTQCAWRSRRRIAPTPVTRPGRAIAFGSPVLSRTARRQEERHSAHARHAGPRNHGIRNWSRGRRAYGTTRWWPAAVNGLKALTGRQGRPQATYASKRTPTYAPLCHGGACAVLIPEARLFRNSEHSLSSVAALCPMSASMSVHAQPGCTLSHVDRFCPCRPFPGS